jgi:hypothetical protein
MPLNFRDAITVARALDIRYLWIDSCCIIQDSVSDWDKEAAQMERIYASAFVTIAATCAASTHEGFLHRSRPQFEPVKVSIPTQRDGRPGCEFILSPGNRHQSRDIVSSPWNKRGWTFQERHLSARILHFCKERICFECRCSDATEDNQLPSVTQQAFWLSQDSRNTKLWFTFLASGKDIGVYDMWYKMMEEYTERLFTFPADRIPAITGISNEMRLLVQDGCVWGLWTNDFARGLLWSRRSDEQSWHRPKESRAPTWSWFAVDGPIGWGGTMSMAITGSGFNLVNSLPSQISSSPSSWPRDIQARARFKRLEPRKRHTGQIRHDHSPRLVGHDIVEMVVLFSKDRLAGFGCLDHCEPGIYTKDVWVCEVQLKPQETGQSGYLDGLLLERVQGKENTFTRIGRFLYDVKDSSPFLGVDPTELTLS